MIKFLISLSKNSWIVGITATLINEQEGNLYGLLKDYSLEESAILGSYCAAQVVSHLGGRLPLHAHTNAAKILSEYKKLYSDGGGL